MDPTVEAALGEVARFYDARQVGAVGPHGFRRSTALGRLLACVPTLVCEGVLVPGQTRLLDLGCADGRVNVFMSYLTQVSVGVDVLDWTLAEYGPLRRALQTHLLDAGLPLPPDNVTLLHGDPAEAAARRALRAETGLELEEFDLLYTFPTGHDLFADLVARHAGPRAVFAVFGLGNVLPSYDGLRPLVGDNPVGGCLGLYRRE